MAVLEVPIDRRALLSQEQAAAYCGVDRKIMRAWMKTPGFPSIVRAPLTQPRIVRAQLDRWLADQIIADTPAEGDAA